LCFALHERDAHGLSLLLELGVPDTDALEFALNESRALRFTEATALLLEQRRQTPGTRKTKKFGR
jgi:hypothetical protein